MILVKVTIKDIAQRAGCSKTSVSFAFNNPERVSKDTYEKIMTAAQEMGYFPDPAARILATKRTNTIGFLLPQPMEDIFHNPYLSEIMRGIGYVCHEHDLMLTILSPIGGIITNAIQQACVDGIILLGVSNESTVHQQFKQRRLPYVTIDAAFTEDYINVGIDDEKAAEEMLDLLLDLGHQRIHFCTLNPIAPEITDITKPNDSLTTDFRKSGIAKSVIKHNFEAKSKEFFSFGQAPYDPEEAIENATRILTQENRPTAIFCMADSHANAFYTAAQKLNIKIPEDLSIVGFDDLPSSKFLIPPLTAVHQPGYEKGKLAAELLFAKISEQECNSIHIETRIEKRGSVAKA